MQLPAYVTVPLPDGVPAWFPSDYQPVLPEAAQPDSKQVQQASKKGSSFKFSATKALAGAGGRQGQPSTSACTTRGDGAFADGSHLLKRGNVCFVSPDALSSANAPQTLQQIENLTGRQASETLKLKGGAAGSQAITEASRSAGLFESQQMLEALQLLTGHSQQPSAHTAVSPFERTCEEDTADSDCAELRSALAPEASDHGASCTPVAAGEPRYSLRRVPASSGAPEHLKVSVSLPGITGAGDTHVDIGATLLSVVASGGRYALSLPLPCAVDEGASRARWRAASQQLVITMPCEQS